MSADTREDALSRLQASGLRGRGGASYEVWRKW